MGFFDVEGDTDASIRIQDAIDNVSDQLEDNTLNPRVDWDDYDGQSSNNTSSIPDALLAWWNDNIAKLTMFVEDTSAFINGLVDEFVANITNLLKNDRNFFGEFYEGITQDKHDADTLDDEGNTVPGVLNAVEETTLGYKIGNGLRTTWITLQEWWDNLDGFIENVTAFAKDPAGYINDRITEVVLNVQNWLKDDNGVLGAFYEGLFSDTMNADGTTSPVPSNTLNNTFKTIGDIVNRTSTVIGDLLRNPSNNSQYGIEFMGLNIVRIARDTLYPAVVAWLEDDEGFLGIVYDWWQGFIDGVSTINVNSLKSSLSGGLEFVTDLWNTTGSAVQGFLGDGIKLVGGVLESLSTTARTSFEDTMVWLADLWDNPLDAIIERTSNFATLIWNKITESITDFGELLGDTYEDIIEFFGNATNIGAKIIDTVFGSGIDDAVSWLENQRMGLRNFFFGDGVSPLAFADGVITSSLESTDAAKIGGTITNKVNTGNKDLLHGLITIVQGLPLVGATLARLITEFSDRFIHKSGTSSRGDIDLGTYDLANVDRIFFNSNDTIDISSPFPHITSFTHETSANMIFFVPSGRAYQYFAGVGGPIMNVARAEIEMFEPLQAYAGLSIGGTTVPDTNGDISLTSNGDIIFRGNGVNRTLTELAAGSGGSSFDTSRITSDLLPDSTANSRSIGSSAKRWDDIYTDSISILANITIGGDLKQGISNDRGAIGFRGKVPVSGESWGLSNLTNTLNQPTSRTTPGNTTFNQFNFNLLLVAFRTLVLDLKNMGILI